MTRSQHAVLVLGVLDVVTGFGSFPVERSNDPCNTVFELPPATEGSCPCDTLAHVDDPFGDFLPTWQSCSAGNECIADHTIDRYCTGGTDTTACYQNYLDVHGCVNISAALMLEKDCKRWYDFNLLAESAQPSEAANFREQASARLASVQRMADVGVPFIFTGSPGTNAAERCQVYLSFSDITRTVNPSGGFGCDSIQSTELDIKYKLGPVDPADGESFDWCWKFKNDPDLCSKVYMTKLSYAEGTFIFCKHVGGKCVSGEPSNETCTLATQIGKPGEYFDNPSYPIAMTDAFTKEPCMSKSLGGQFCCVGEYDEVGKYVNAYKIGPVDAKNETIVPDGTDPCTAIFQPEDCSRFYVTQGDKAYACTARAGQCVTSGEGVYCPFAQNVRQGSADLCDLWSTRSSKWKVCLRTI